ncbi:hypothetical protein [Dermabacter hominis]|uniref:hypothetical protein n=1 Tax=Dermabacter hominis TaxID=36740 RepID=UPI00316AE1A0
MAKCQIWELGCQAEEGALEALGGAIESLADAVTEAYGKIVASLGTVWVNVGTPNLTGEGGGSSIEAGTAPPGSEGIETTLSYVMWLGGGLAVLSLVALGAMMAVGMRRGRGDTFFSRGAMVLAGITLVSGAASLVAAFMPSGPNATAGATLFVQSSLWWLMGGVAIVSVMVAGIRMVWTQRAEPGKDLIQSILTLIVVAGAGTTITALLVAAADQFAVWVINASLECDVAADTACFGENLLTMLALTSNSAVPGLGPLLIIILGLIAILLSLIQIVLMVARAGMLVVLAGILPISAAATNTEMGKAWFKRCVGWLTAVILYKPAAAIVYAAAFQLTGTSVFTDDGSGIVAVVTGLMLMLLALIALPALMRFVTPLVGPAAGGAASGMAAAGMMAAIPVGASAAGRLGGMMSSQSRAGGGGGSSSSSTTSSSTSSQTAGASGPTGGSSVGSSGRVGGSGADGSAVRGPSGSGSRGAGGSAGSDGATGGASAGAKGAPGVGRVGASGTGGSAGLAGGSGAAGAAGASGAAGAAGPAGLAVGAAVAGAKKVGEVGKAAQGAAQGVASDATGEGEGPSGSR